MNVQYAAHILGLLGGEEVLRASLGPKLRLSALVGAQPGLRIECGTRAEPFAVEIVHRALRGYRVTPIAQGRIDSATDVAEQDLVTVVFVLTGWKLPAAAIERAVGARRNT
ncbi:hypothetical protein [Dolichospermum phage Dfl-JY45]